MAVRGADCECECQTKNYFNKIGIRMETQESSLPPVSGRTANQN